jgi:nucleotide-binding universal stress UspA family protein
VTGFKTIAVGYDASEDSALAVQWAADLASHLGARLLIIHAVGLLEAAGLSDHVAAHRERAVDIATRAGLDPGQVEWSAVDGDPCTALLRETGSPAAVDLLVVGSRGSGRRSGTILGSTSLELAEHSTVPVAVVRTTPAD